MQVQEARTQPPSFVQRRRLGRHPARKMQRMVVETSSSMLAVGGYVIEPERFVTDTGTGKRELVAGTGRVEIVVLADEAPRVMAMLEKDTAGIEECKRLCALEMDEALQRDYGIGPEALQSEKALRLKREVLPHTWQRTFYETRRRSVGPLCFAEKIGDPIEGHPDGLDKDLEAVPEAKIAKMVADGVAAGMAPLIAAFTEALKNLNRK